MKLQTKNLLLACFCFFIFVASTFAQPKKQKEIAVIGYYAGNSQDIDQYPVDKLTHIIFSFLHLKGNILAVDNKNDSLTIKRLVELKKKNPKLKVILSLGGWEGCYTCSGVFSTQKAREEFAVSVKKLFVSFNADGLDLDWEYPAIAGPPGHPFMPEDKPNFTALIKTLRTTFGNKYELSFAAGGFTKYIEESVEWEKVTPLLDRINLMSYDLVHGYSEVSGHHTGLYSTPQLKESVDNGVKMLLAKGVPADKIAIGAAMYGRVFKLSATENNGLYQPCKFERGVSYNSLEKYLAEHKTYKKFWDSTAQAPYLFAEEEKLFFSYDDPESMKLKTEYVIKNKLNGIMFWQLREDKPQNGLLEVIDKTLKEK